MEIQYLFIDGGCLRETLDDYSQRFFDNDKIEFDYERFGREYQKVFYYDSPPPQKSDENDLDYHERIRPTREFFTQLNLLDGFHVYEGSSRRRRSKVEQKKVDIMISVDMLNHSFRKNMSRATLLTSDLDFKPLIDALVDNGMFINLWYPINKTNIELIQSADSSKKLDLYTVFDYCRLSFKNSHYIPKSSSKIGQDLFNVTKIENLRNRYGIEGELFKANDRLTHYILFKTYHNERAYIHLEHEDVDKLKAYFDEYTYPTFK